MDRLRRSAADLAGPGRATSECSAGTEAVLERAHPLGHGANPAIGLSASRAAELYTSRGVPSPAAENGHNAVSALRDMRRGRTHGRGFESPA